MERSSTRIATTSGIPTLDRPLASRRVLRLGKALVLAALFVCAGTVQAQVTVTASAGTLGPTNYTTLGAAFTAVNAGTHQGVITVDVNGNTTETATAALNSGAVAPASWTAMSITPSGSPRIIEGSITGAVVKLNGADNVTIDGRIAGTGRNLTIRNNNNASTTAAIWLSSVAVGNGCTGNTIRNCEIACGTAQNTGSLTSWGIIMNGTTISNTANGVDNDNNTFQENRIIKCRHGIVTRGTTTNLNDNIQVIDNIVGPSSHGPDQIGIVGIYMQADNNSTVRGNTVQFVGGPFASTTSGADRYGIAIGVNAWSMTPGTLTSTGYTVSRNLVHDIIEERTFSAVGIGLQTTNGGLPTNNVVCSNMIYNVKANGTGGDQAVGLGIAGGWGDQVVYNSIRMSGDVDPDAAASVPTNFGSGIRIGLDNGTTHANLTLKNNLVYMDLSSSSSTTVRFYAISGRSTAYSFGTGGEDHNAYYRNLTNLNTDGLGGLGTASGATLSNQYQNLVNWQAAYTTPQDANSIQVDPGFISSTDLHISSASTAVNNLGTTSGVTCAIDFDNQARNGSTPDIGADEYAPLVCAGADGGTITPSTASACAGGTYVMTTTGSVAGVGITNQWRVSSTPGGPYSPVTGGSGATTTAYTTGPLVVGTYYFVMTNTCSFGGVDDSNELTLTVNPVPTATAGSNSPVCAGQALNLTGTTDIGATFSWTGPGGFTSSSQNPSVSASATLAMAGSYTFTATAAGCSSAPSSANVVINPLPTISSTTATPNPTCFNGNSTLNVSAVVDAPFVRISEVTINRGGTGAQASYPVTITGADLVELNNTSSLQVDISGWSLAAYGNNNAVATHSITFPSGTIIPANGWLVVTLGTGTNDVTNRVYFTGGANDSYLSSSAIGVVLKTGSSVVDALGTQNTGSYVFAAGTGVTATDWSGSFNSISGRAGFLRSAAVDSNTGADWVPYNTPSPLSSIGTFNPGYTNPASGSVSSYLWTPNTFLSADNITNPLASGVNVASQAYTVTVTSSAGCPSQGNVTVTTTGQITAATITGTLSFCTGGSTTITAVPTDGAAPYTYLWSPGGATTAAIVVNAGGSYSCQVSDNCGGSVNTGSVTVVENAIPTAIASSNSPVCVGQPLNLTGTTDIGTSFSWTGPGGFTSSSQNPSVSASATLAMAGVYSMTATASGCTSPASSTTVVVNQAPAITALTATPNPTCFNGNSLLDVTAGVANPSSSTGGAITINASGNATPYPSTVTAAGLPVGNTIVKQVLINGYAHTFPADVDVALRSPSGTSVIIMSDAGGTGAVTGRNLVFQDGFPLLPSGAASGTYGCTSPNSPDNFPAPGPGSLSQLTPTLASFNGDLNGTWELFIMDDASGDAGTITSWSIVFEYGAAATTYLWTPNTFLNFDNIANPLASGVNVASQAYTVTVSSGAGCTATGTANVTTVVVDDGNPCTVDACLNGVVTNTFVDTDLDGTCDANDGCPTDPNKIAAGICGCGTADTNSDGDLLADCLDGCPFDANKTSPGVCGCGTADVPTTYYADVDGDGFGDPAAPVAGFTCITPGGAVANSSDGCPTDPAKQAPGLCGCGNVDVDINNNNICDTQEPEPFIKLGIEKVAGQDKLELRLLPNGNFNGLISSTVITVRWLTTPGVTVSGPAYVDPTYLLVNGPVLSQGTSTDGLYSYATFATIGTDVLANEGLTWTANTEVPFYRLNYTNTSNSCVTFEVVDDAYQTNNNLNWFISLNAVDKTNGYIPGKTSLVGYPAASCQNLSVTLDVTGNASITAAQVNTSFIGCPPVGLSLDQSAFTCADLGANAVLLTATDGYGAITTCAATITVLQLDSDGDLTNDCADGCPTDPLKIAPGVCGCNVPEVNVDNDNVCDTDELEPNVQLGIVDHLGSLEIRLLPDHFFNDLVSGTVITVRWLTTPGVSLSGPAVLVDPAYANSIGPVLATPTVTDGLYSYRTFTTIGNASLYSEGLSWTAGTEVPLFRVSYSNTGSSCVDFEVVSDAYQTNNNISWFISCNALDKTNGYIAGKTSVLSYPPAQCQPVTATLPLSGSASITPAQVSSGFIGCPPVALSLSNSAFTCADLGANTVTLTAIDGKGATTSCTATITVIDLDTDGDATGDCADGCPLDPLKTAPGICGCGNVDIDLDNDNVCDADELEPNVQLGIVDHLDSLEIRLLPDHFFNDLVSGTVVTIRWQTTPGVSVSGTQFVGDPMTMTAVYGPITSLGTTNDGIYSYATFATIGGASLASEGFSWTANVEVPFFRVNYTNTGSSCVTFEVVDDTYQDGNNIEWFISCNALDKTNGYIAGKTNVLSYPPAQCQPVTATLPLSGSASITPAQVSSGFIGCPPVALSLSNNTFTCADLGANTVTLTAIDGKGVTTSCTATVTVIDLDTDGDATSDCADGCPTDPLKTAPGLCGCGNVDIDLDGDNVCDADETEPNVKLGIIDVSGDLLELRLLPDHFFNDLVSSTVMTVRWPTTAGVSVGGATYVNPAYLAATGPIVNLGTTTDGIYSYATIATVGGGSLFDAGLAWTANTEVPFIRMDYTNTSGACITFEVLDDTYQDVNNLQWFISCNALDKTNGYIPGKTSSTGYPAVSCQDVTVTLDVNGEATVTPAMVNTGTFAACSTPTLSLSQSLFDCTDVGVNAIVLSVAYPGGPTLTCSSNVTVISTLTASSTAGTIACTGGTTTVTVSATGGTGPYTGTGPQIVGAGPYSFTVTDANGCTSTTTGTVIVLDNVPPAITCPANITAGSDPGQCGAIVNYVAPVGTDNCSGAVTTLTGGPASGSFFPLGATTVTYTVTDLFSNTASCSFTVTVTDTQAPTIVACPSNISVNAGASCNAVATWTAPTVTDNCSGASIAQTAGPVSGSTFPLGNTTITYTATDGAGLTSSCSFTVTVVDVTAPTIVACPSNITVNAGASCNAVANWTAPTVTDNCSGASIAQTGGPVSGSTFPLGNTTITYTATDGAGLTSSCSFTVTVVDVTAPSIVACPSNISVNAGASCNAVANWAAPTVSDNCSGASIAQTGGPASGSTFPLGNTTITYTATDGAGLTSSCSFTVTVVDVTAPSIVACPSNISVNAGASCNAVANWAAPTVTDNCSGASIAQTAGPVSGSTFPLGSTTITYTATDGAGLTSSCSFTVTVVDVTAPSIVACPSNISVNAGASCNAVATWTAPTVTDNCSGASIAQTAGPSSGSAFPLGSSTITYTATDGAGLTSSCSFTVTVVDVTAPSIVACPSNISVNAGAGCDAVATWIAPTVTDNCSGASIAQTAGPVSGSTFPLGSTTITYTATDGAGLTSSCSFTVTVVDVTAPSIVACPSNITVNAGAGCDAVATWAAPTVTDNCSGASIAQTAGPVSGSTFPLGSTTITYTATDGAGLTSSCSFTVTVVDVTAPSIVACPSNISVNAGASCNAVATWTAPTVTDNCSGASIAQTAGPSSGSTFPLGSSTITYTATDGAGLTSSCSFTVTVVDVTAPTISGCPANISLTTNSGLCNGAVATWTAPTATDNCSVGSLTSTHNSGDTFPLGVTTVTYTATDGAGNAVSCTFTVTVTIVDTDGDGVCDINDSCPTVPGQVGDACDDGNPNTFLDVLNASCVCQGQGFVAVSARMMLEGPYDAGTDRMKDDLRLAGIIPSGQPYTSAPFNYTGTETIGSGVLTVTGDDAIVDWVLLELRNDASPAVIQARRAALIQRDGDVVDTDGTSSVNFAAMPPGNYRIAVRHRNHLGVMTGTSYSLSTTPTAIDLSVASTPAYGTDARKSSGGRLLMWGGNARVDAQLRYTGAANDRDAILVRIGGSVPTAVVNGYYVEDVNLNGQVKYTGASNDREFILVNILSLPGGTVLSTRFEQLP